MFTKRRPDELTRQARITGCSRLTGVDCVRSLLARNSRRCAFMVQQQHEASRATRREVLHPARKVRGFCTIVLKKRKPEDSLEASKMSWIGGSVSSHMFVRSARKSCAAPAELEMICFFHSDRNLRAVKGQRLQQEEKKEIHDAILSWLRTSFPAELTQPHSSTRAIQHGPKQRERHLDYVPAFLLTCVPS